MFKTFLNSLSSFTLFSYILEIISPIAVDNENIDINMYDMFQKKLSSRIEKYKIEILELEKKCSSLEPLDVRIENAKKSIRKLLDISYNGVDEKIIEEFVEKVIVHKDYFEWKLNFMNETIKLEVNGKDGFMLEHK